MIQRPPPQEGALNFRLAALGVEEDTIPKPDGLDNATIKSKFEQASHEIVRCT